MPYRDEKRRSRRPFRVGGALLGALLLSTGLRAQTAPVPTIPPEQPVPDATTTTPDGQGPVEPPPLPRPRSWEYSFGVGAGHDSNIEFAQPNGPGGLVLAPRGEIARLFRGPRGSLRAVVGSRWAAYPEDSQLNRYYADGRLDGDYRSGPHTTWRGTVAYGFGYSDASPILLQQGVALPLAKTRSFSTNASFAQQVAAKTTLTIEGRFYRAAIDEPLLTNGSSVRGTAALIHQFGARSSGGVVYAVEKVLTDEANRHYNTHFATVQWTHFPTPRSAFLLEGGLSYTENAASAGLGRQENFFGGASYTRRLGGSAVTLLLRREVTPAFGFAVSLLETRGGVRAELPIAQDWRVRLEASHSQPDNVAEAGLIGRPPYSDALFSLVRRLGKSLEISAETRYRRRGETSTLGVISSFQGGVFLTITPPGGAKLPQWGLF